MKEPFEIVLGDRVTTTDSDTPAPVIGFRSEFDDGAQRRPWILVESTWGCPRAWYYPHELEVAHPKEAP